MDNTSGNNLRLTDRQGQLLVRLARATIAKELGISEHNGLEYGFEEPIFKEKLGVFVTLKIKGQLRGCIGSLSGEESIYAGVKRNAVNAAFNDPRFSQLTPDEFSRVDIEVSILTKPQALQYKDGNDLLNCLRPNVDGVIIRKGIACATFLPQVWDQLPQPENFLSHLCNKAGLNMDSWKDGDLEVETYIVQKFQETTSEEQS